MILIPDTPYDTKSYGEKILFDRLKECFSDSKDYIAFHSYDIYNLKKQRTGESDFLILCPNGVFALEVKGGSEISFESGQWYSKNRHGKEKINHPFKQAHDGIHAVAKKIEDNGDIPITRLPIGYGVAFPNCSWDQVLAEWDRQIICDGKNIRNLEKWLTNFFGYWGKKYKNNFTLDSNLIKEIKDYLRPDFELIEPLYDRIAFTEEKAVQLTQDQYILIDATMDNDRVLCSGGGGTGKTFLAAEISRRKSDAGKNVLFVCKSPWLKNYLEKKLAGSNIIVSTIEGVNRVLRRGGIEGFDALVVDEGQDLFNFSDLETLDNCLLGGLENGEWYIFHDVNNQANLFDNTSSDAFEYLLSFDNVAKVALTKNCRNTLQILEKVKERLSLDMGVSGTGNGPSVFEHVSCQDEAVTQVQNKIHELLAAGVSPGSITILSPLSFKESIASKLSLKVPGGIMQLDEYSTRNFPPPNISFAEIRNFKGMENEVIVLIDLIAPDNLLRTEDKVHHYVGMSRARGLLCAFWIESQMR